MKFSLVIPCYNEANNLPLLLDRCAVLTSLPGIEVLLVDNGSTDHSASVLADLLPHYPGCVGLRIDRNQGYGSGILAGLRAAKGRTLGWTHADLQTDPQDVLRGLALFDRFGTDIFVKGRRYGRPLTDVVFTLGMSGFETALLRYPMWDINAQPTLFSRAFFETWIDPPYDFSIDLFAYYHARHARLAVHRFPVMFGERAHGVSHWNVDWASKRNFIARTVNFSFELKKKLKP